MWKRKMILQNKKTKRLYNFIGMDSDGVNCSLKLELWYRNKAGKIANGKRTFTYSSFDRIKELLNSFDELAGLQIDKANFEVYEHEAEQFRLD